MLRMVVVLAALAGPGSAFADQTKRVDQPAFDPSKRDCTCPAFGKDFHLGETVCLRTPKGFRMAQCVMVLNNTSWSFTEQECPRS